MCIRWLFLSVSLIVPLAGQDLFRSAEPAVLRIEVQGEEDKAIAHGSGFLVASDGKFLTNHHVVKDAKRITVRLANDDAYDTVEVIDIDRRKDIVLLKLRGVDLPFLP